MVALKEHKIKLLCGTLDLLLKPLFMLISTRKRSADLSVTSIKKVALWYQTRRYILKTCEKCIEFGKCNKFYI